MGHSLLAPLGDTKPDRNRTIKRMISCIVSMKEAKSSSLSNRNLSLEIFFVIRCCFGCEVDAYASAKENTIKDDFRN